MNRSISPSGLPPLRRHQLAFLTPEVWDEVLAHAWDDQAEGCLSHWRKEGLPLVVTRQHPPHAGTGQQQPDETAHGQITLGLAAPMAWGRRRLALQVPRQGIGRFDEFPPLNQVLHHLPPSTWSTLRKLRRALAAAGLRAHAYGSVGWQHVSRQPYLHAGSDLDLWIGVQTSAAADRAVAALQQHAPEHLRVDGELVFPDGSAVAWREWEAWRAGRAGALLVKRLHGASLEPAPPAPQR